MNKIVIGLSDFTKKEIGQMVLREYEKGEISTGRTYELLEELFNGRIIWDIDNIWSKGDE